MSKFNCVAIVNKGHTTHVCDNPSKGRTRCINGRTYPRCGHAHRDTAFEGQPFIRAGGQGDRLVDPKMLAASQDEDEGDKEPRLTVVAPRAATPAAAADKADPAYHCGSDSPLVAPAASNSPLAAPAVSSPLHVAPAASSPLHVAPAASSPPLIDPKMRFQPQVTFPVPTDDEGEEEEEAPAYHCGSNPSHAVPAAPLAAPAGSNPSHAVPAATSPPLAAPAASNSPLVASAGSNSPHVAPAASSPPLVAPAASNSPLAAPAASDSPQVAPAASNSPLVAPAASNSPLAAPAASDSPQVALAASISPLVAPAAPSPTHVAPAVPSPTHVTPAGSNSPLAAPAASSPPLAAPAASSPLHVAPVAFNSPHVAPAASNSPLAAPAASNSPLAASSPPPLAFAASSPTHVTPAAPSPTHVTPAGSNSPLAAPAATSLPHVAPVASNLRPSPVVSDPVPFAGAIATPTGGPSAAAEARHDVPSKPDGPVKGPTDAGAPRHHKNHPMGSNEIIAALSSNTTSPSKGQKRGRSPSTSTASSLKKANKGEGKSRTTFPVDNSERTPQQEDELKAIGFKEINRADLDTYDFMDPSDRDNFRAPPSTQRRMNGRMFYLGPVPQPKNEDADVYGFITRVRPGDKLFDKEGRARLVKKGTDKISKKTAAAFIRNSYIDHSSLNHILGAVMEAGMMETKKANEASEEDERRARARNEMRRK